MKRVQGRRPASVTGSLAKGAACSFLTPLSEAVARFDNAPFQIRRKPSKAGALGRRGLPLCCVRCSAMAARESRGLFSLASRSEDKPARKGGFVYKASATTCCGDRNIMLPEGELRLPDIRILLKEQL